jgi:hypothetical protein
MKTVTSKQDFLTTRHWAIVKFDSVHIPADERSKTNPGHGYPAHDQPIVRYEIYETKEEWVEAIRKLESQTYDRNKYMAIEAIPAKISTQIKVDID